MGLKDMLKSIKEPGSINLSKDLDLYLSTKFFDLHSVDRQSGWSKNMHASSISGCARGEVYSRISVPAKEEKISPRVQRIFDNGSSFHERMQNYYKRMKVLWGTWRCHGCGGYGVPQVMKTVGDEKEGQLIPTGCKFRNCTEPPCPLGFPTEWVAGMDIRPFMRYIEPGFYVDRYHLSGYTDGIIVTGNERTILELKSMNGEQHSKLVAPVSGHTDQIQVYMYGFNLEYASLQYENKNNQQVKEFVIERDPKRIGELLGGVEFIWNCLSTSQIPPRVCRLPVDGRFCGFVEACFDDFFDYDPLWEAYKQRQSEEG